MPSERISVVLPVYNEHENIGPCLRGLWRALAGVEHEILVCYDFEADSTLPAIAAMPDRPPTVRLVKNDLGKGAANALRAGFAAASGDVVVTTMADLSDPPEVILEMARTMRAERVAVVSGSRYMKGGSQTGGPLFKRICSQTASLTLSWLTGIGTRDATSNFRAYSREFLARTPVESRAGFEIALELTVKAHLAGAGVAEVPSTWTDRTAGESRFRLWKWAPSYLRWYWEAAAAPVLAWAVWLAMLVGALAFVASYAGVIPQRDDLEWAAQVRPWVVPPAEWWWSPFNEHRIPLPRVFFLGLVWTTQDIRSGMFFDVLVLGAVAAACMLVARRLRGRTSTTDLFFPLLWLTVGNAENLLMMHQVSLIVPSAITSALLLFFAARPGWPTPARAGWIAACLASLPLCGAPGLTVTPPIALWCVWAGWRMLRARDHAGASALGERDERSERRAAWTLLAGAAATAAIVAVYFVDFDNPRSAGYLRDPLEVLRQATMFLSLGAGPAAQDAWPTSGFVAVLVLVATLAVLALALARRPAERPRILGLAAVGAGIVCMALSTGIARGFENEWAAFALRYVTLPAPWLCAAYFVFCLYAPPAVGRTARLVLCTGLVLAFGTNLVIGKRFGEARAAVDRRVRAEIGRGMDLRTLSILYWQEFYGDPESLENRFELLRQAGFGPLAGARPSVIPEPLPGFESQPWMVNGEPTGPRKVGDENVFLVPPRCELVFPVLPWYTVVEGRFGLYPPAAEFARGGGVRFSVEFVELLTPTHVLWERTLEPAAEGAPGATQRATPGGEGATTTEDQAGEAVALEPFRVELPPNAQGVIVLRTTFGAGGGGELGDKRAFGCWSAVSIR